MPDADLRLKLLELRLKRAFNLSQGSADRKNTLIARFKSGFGEGSSSIHYGWSSEKCFEAVSERLQKFDGSWDVDAIRRLVESLPQELNVARCAIEMALLDQLAKELEMPLWEYLKLPKPAPVPSAFTVTFSDNDDVMRQLETASAFHVLKLKVGFKGDLEFVDFVLKHADKQIFLDANGGWSAPEALDRIRSLAGYPIEFFEQPIGDPQLRDLDALKSRSNCVIFLDESIKTITDIEHFLPVVDGVNLKLSKCGGISNVITMAERAKELELKLLIGCMLESSIGITAALHLGGLFDYFDLDSIMLTENDPYWGAQFDAGMLILPEGTGIGITTRETTLA